jgi:hypothetical protein
MMKTVRIALRVGKQIQGLSVLINKQTQNSITPEERTNGRDRYREDNQGGDGVQVSVMRQSQ